MLIILSLFSTSPSAAGLTKSGSLCSPCPSCVIPSCAFMSQSRSHQNVLPILCPYLPTRRLHVVWLVRAHENDAWVVGSCQTDSAEFSLYSIQLMVFKNLRRMEAAETFTSLANSAEGDRKFKTFGRKGNCWMDMAWPYEPQFSGKPENKKYWLSRKGYESIPPRRWHF